MYAVVKSGGKQYKVQEGETFRVEKLPGDVGGEITFDDVLMVADGENVQVGTPRLDNVAVKGTVVEQGQAKKIIVFKYKRRKRYRRKQGHRQQFTAVKVDSITISLHGPWGSDIVAFDPNLVDAVFFTLSSIEKFAIPYYTSTLGVEQAAVIQAELTRAFLGGGS